MINIQIFEDFSLFTFFDCCLKMFANALRERERRKNSCAYLFIKCHIDDWENYVNLMNKLRISPIMWWKGMQILTLIKMDSNLLQPQWTGYAVTKSVYKFFMTDKKKATYVCWINMDQRVGSGQCSCFICLLYQ